MAACRLTLSLTLSVCVLLCRPGEAARSRCKPLAPLADPSGPQPLVIAGRLLAFYPTRVPHVRFPVRRRGLIQVNRVLLGQVSRPQVLVEGFYKLGVCNSRLRLRDTRIFLLRAPRKRPLQARYKGGNGTAMEVDFQLISTAKRTQKNVDIVRTYSG